MGLHRLPAAFQKLRLPVVAAPMFLVSGPEVVIASCRAGIVGTLPALNQRTTEGYEQWLTTIEAGLAGRPNAGPYGVNLIVHKTNPRLEADLKVTVAHKVPLVITSLGAVKDVVEAVHSYGGVVFHDVINVRHAEKAIEAGVDGVICVSAGAGGHAGTLSPFALVPEVRQIFDGAILLAGCLSSGSHVLAARAIGADLAYMGTRFISTRESLASDGYKQMVCGSSAKDIVYTPAISGVHASFLRQSIMNAGLNPDALGDKPHKIDFGAELNVDAKAWKDIWSAGQGVGSIDNVPSIADLVRKLEFEYKVCLGNLNSA